MLNQVQHDSSVRFLPFCHPEPGPEPCPETSSGSNEFRIYDFGISVLSLEFGFKAPPCGRGSLRPLMPFVTSLDYDKDLS
jgi:hypothetical protein